jgi:hypothetical protein
MYVYALAEGACCASDATHTHRARPSRAGVIADARLGSDAEPVGVAPHHGKSPINPRRFLPHHNSFSLLSSPRYLPPSPKHCLTPPATATRYMLFHPWTILKRHLHPFIVFAPWSPTPTPAHYHHPHSLFSLPEVYERSLCSRPPLRLSHHQSSAIAHTIIVAIDRRNLYRPREHACNTPLTTAAIHIQPC